MKPVKNLLKLVSSARLQDTRSMHNKTPFLDTGNELSKTESKKQNHYDNIKKDKII